MHAIRKQVLFPAVAATPPPLAATFSSPEPAARALLIVTALHLIALAWLLRPVEATLSQQPVLAFTVTLMDLSSSPSAISSAASAASAPAQKPQPKMSERPVPVAGPTQLKKTTPVIQSSQKAAKLSHNSVQQTAVLAPVTPASFDAAYLQNPPPAYPALSRRLGEQGKVLLQVYVNETGRAETVQVKASSGFNRLDDAARETVSRWRFAAARQGERLMASWVQVPVRFVLE